MLHNHLYELHFIKNNNDLNDLLIFYFLNNILIVDHDEYDKL